MYLLLRNLDELLEDHLFMEKSLMKNKWEFSTISKELMMLIQLFCPELEMQLLISLEQMSLFKFLLILVLENKKLRGLDEF